MNPEAKNFLQGAIATAGAVGAYGLGNLAAKQYRKKGYEETGSAFVQPAQQNILNQYIRTTPGRILINNITQKCMFL